MEQDAHPKDAGSYLKKQWLKLFETDPGPNTHRIPYIYICREIYHIIEIIRLYELNTKMGKTPTLCDKTPSPGILPHHSDQS